MNLEQVTSKIERTIELINGLSGVHKKELGFLEDIRQQIETKASLTDRQVSGVDNMLKWATLTKDTDRRTSSAKQMPLTPTRRSIGVGDVERIKSMHRNGMTYGKISGVLSSEGIDSDRGTELTGADLSRFMIDNGYQVHKRKSKINRPDDSPIIKAAIEIIDSDISNEVKEMLLKNIFVGGAFK